MPPAEQVDIGKLKDRYVLDTSYTWGFYSGQSPALINYAARLNGIETRPVEEPFTYLELGCGNGLTACVLADALPQGEFYAVDLNPEHIDNGKGIADEAGLENLNFIRGAFEDLVSEKFPEFDYIVLHGVYSWVSDEVRRDIVTVIRKYLKPGGLVYVSYNALPGWAPLMPLREIMLSYGALHGGTSLDRAAEGLRYLTFLRERKAAYFERNPGTGQMLDMLLKQDLRYLAHEYLNESWHPLYFSQVATEMAGADLSFCGSADIARNYLDLTIPEEFQPLLRTANNDLVRETHKSLILNERFRSDLFCRKANFVPQDDRSRLFANSIFGCQVPDTDIKREVKVGDRLVGYSGKIYEDLIPSAAGGTRSATELAHLPALENYGADSVIRALNHLVAGGQFSAFAQRARESKPEALDNFRICSDFNRTVLKRRLLSDGHCPLASPVLGNGLVVGLTVGLLLLAWEEVGAERASERACELVSQSGRNLLHDGQPVVDPAKRQTLLENDQRNLRERLLPFFAAAGIIAARGE